jgi:hypothetical protein
MEAAGRRCSSSRSSSACWLGLSPGAEASGFDKRLFQGTRETLAPRDLLPRTVDDPRPSDAQLSQPLNQVLAQTKPGTQILVAQEIQRDDGGLLAQTSAAEIEEAAQVGNPVVWRVRRGADHFFYLPGQPLARTLGLLSNGALEVVERSLTEGDERSPQGLQPGGPAGDFRRASQLETLEDQFGGIEAAGGAEDLAGREPPALERGMREHPG